jgi:hypothetical protein
MTIQIGMARSAAALLRTAEIGRGSSSRVLNADSQTERHPLACGGDALFSAERRDTARYKQVTQ